MPSHATLEMYSIEYRSIERDGVMTTMMMMILMTRVTRMMTVMIIVQQSSCHDNHVHASFAFQFSS